MNLKIFGGVKLNNENIAIKDMSLSLSGPIKRPNGEINYLFHIHFTRVNHRPLSGIHTYDFSHHANTNFFNEFSSECESSKNIKIGTKLRHVIGDSRESFEINEFKSDFMKVTITPSKNIVNISIGCDLIGGGSKLIDEPMNILLTLNISKKEFENISNIK